MGPVMVRITLAGLIYLTLAGTGCQSSNRLFGPARGLQPSTARTVATPVTAASLDADDGRPPEAAAALFIPGRSSALLTVDHTVPQLAQLSAAQPPGDSVTPLPALVVADTP